MTISKLPDSLTNCLADSQAEVMSWSADSGTLVLRITKEIGPEAGELRLTGVGYVSLQPRFELSGVALYDKQFHDYPSLCLETDEIALALHDSEGHVHLVVAESLDYVIDKKTGA